MESKHIALFIRYLPIGGIQKIVVRLANEFVKRGHTVDLVLAKGKGAMASEVASGVQIVDLNKRRVWMALPALWQYLQKENPDVLFAAEAPANLVAIAASMFLNHRLVVSVRSNMTQYGKGGEVWYGPYILTMVRCFYPLADKIIAVSEGVLEDLSSISLKAARKGGVIYNPVVDSEIFQKAEEPVSHPWFEEDVPVVLGVGRLTPQKNFDLLLRTFARLRREHDARLIILGDGNQRERLEARTEALKIEDCVDLPGFVSNPYPFMANASLFALSSDFEGFGIVLVEALACGCPVVSTDCPSGPREILEDGKWGRLVPVGDEEALAEAMHEALSEEHDPERLRRRAMDFSVNKAVNEYLDELFLDA